MQWVDRSVWDAFTSQGTDAHRLASGPQLWIERFGDDLLVSYKTREVLEALLPELEMRCAGYDFTPSRVFGKYLPQQADERAAPELLRGLPERSRAKEISEAQVHYGLDFGAGYSAGFFIDQRENRARVRQLRPRRTLNTFAYTCSFSVVAALGGGETVSVDLSRRSLARGEENFLRNGLNSDAGHRFLADDALAVLPRLARRGETFDCIILDPPTFSRNHRGTAFQVQRDFEQLLSAAVEIAAPGAHVLLSVNHSGMRVADLEQISRGVLRVRGRSGQLVHTPALRDFPPGEGARTVWLDVR